ncbi:MAG: quinoprotein relay system zinc metallohydrolase 2 [Pseudomonadota bacterium]|nr:quinoprotein relay system zinc metallohydrolase 2 [Pseudomonadota bacterium]
MNIFLKYLFLFVFGLVVLARLNVHSDTFNMQKIADGIYVHTGFHHHGLHDIANIGFIVGEESIAVIDTGSSLAIGDSLKKAIRSVSSLPVRYVINTHIHPDHFFGNSAFEKDDPIFIGHENLSMAFQSTGTFYLGRMEEELGKGAVTGREFQIDVTPVAIGKPLSIDLGNRVLTITAYPHSHTRTDITVFDAKTKTLWLSDLLFIDRIPALIGGGTISGWIEVSEELKQIDAALVVPGHGPASASWPKAIDPQIEYLKVIRQDIRKIIAEGGSINDAVGSAGQSQRNKWKLFEDVNGGNVTGAFAELEWE